MFTIHGTFFTARPIRKIHENWKVVILSSRQLCFCCTIYSWWWSSPRFLAVEIVFSLSIYCSIFWVTWWYFEYMKLLLIQYFINYFLMYRYFVVSNCYCWYQNTTSIEVFTDVTFAHSNEIQFFRIFSNVTIVLIVLLYSHYL
jgi:hypothetical protein